MATRSSSSSSRRPKPTDVSIGNFVIDQEIGKGSFAVVYGGRHKATGALVAIKAVEVGRLSKKLRDNLYGEIKILTALRHPHIVALHDCVESATHINLIMEYCELGDLSMFIKKREKLLTNPATHDMARKYPNAPNSGLNEVIIRHFVKQLASALQFLREGTFIHRDVKPQNLLLLPSPQYRESSKNTKYVLSASQDSLNPAAGLPSLPMLKLADFGFARVLPSTSLAETLCGSPLYMAPEILRYEKYDAKADLWSVGTVVYEMVTGKPPFRASNHVELLRKIEAAEDQIRFPRESVASPELKGLIRTLLKRNPIERISFDNFFQNPVVVNPIPGTVEDDIPKEERRISREIRAAMKTDDPLPPSRRSSFRRYPATDADGSERGVPLSPKPRRSSPLATPIEATNPFEQQLPRTVVSNSPGREVADGLGIRRPVVQPSTSAPSRPPIYNDRRSRGLSNASLKAPNREPPSSSSPTTEGHARSQPKRAGNRGISAEQERAAQDVAFERDYVLIDKKLVEINSFADQMAAEKVPAPKPGQMIKRATQQGPPTSTTGAVPSSPSRNMQIVSGRDHYRHGSYDKALSGSPGSTTAAAATAISKAIQDASLRLFGFRHAANIIGKGQSPPQIYSPFPAYPTPTAPAGLISDGRSAPLDEDTRVAQCIEDLATRSDVVYGFAEVKYKQLVPLAPSMEYGLGGISAAKMAEEDDDGLTAEAKVALSEEALVLYVKGLSLLGKSMDIAGLWWSRKTRNEPHSGSAATREANNNQRINSIVQWIRNRFNEVLEKAEIVRLKLVEAQRQLPEDHPSHPSNHKTELTSASSSSADGVFLTPGVTAEKLMYDRAVEMSRAAAINEIASEDLEGCELSYITAVRMLEAVLESEDDLPRRKVSGASKDADNERDENPGEINGEDQETVQKLIQAVMSRLVQVRNKMQRIAAASRAQAQQLQQPPPVRRQSGDIRTAPAS